jgi:hypothetical protein
LNQKFKALWEASLKGETGNIIQTHRKVIEIVNASGKNMYEDEDYKELEAEAKKVLCAAGVAKNVREAMKGLIY